MGYLASCTVSVSSYLQGEIPADVLVGSPRLAARLFVHVQSPTQVLEPGSGSLQTLVLLAHSPAPRTNVAAAERRRRAEADTERGRRRCGGGWLLRIHRVVTARHGVAI